MTQRTGWASMPATFSHPRMPPPTGSPPRTGPPLSGGLQLNAGQQSPLVVACPLVEGQAPPPRQLPGPLGTVTLPVPLSSYIVPVGIEDKESWHGKPLPKNMADQIIQEIYGQIQSKKKILATPPQEDAPSVDITNIRMPTPPSYKVGDKVPS